VGVEQNRQLHILREISERFVEIGRHPDAFTGAGARVTALIATISRQGDSPS
jgi:hypothetical protein